MGKERGDDELEVFRRFAVAAGLHNSHDCGEKRRSPEPDILFHPADGEPTAFELVELVDQDYAGRIGLLIGTKTALRTYYEALPPFQRKPFDLKYGNALLYFRFRASLTFKRRRAAFGAIFDELLALPNDFIGDAFEDECTLSQVLEGVSISRGRFVGPIFDPESVGWIGDPTVPSIREKFTKSYSTPHSIELLAYIETNPMFPDEVWIADLEEFLSAQPRPLPFRRIWVFDLGRNEVLFRYE